MLTTPATITYPSGTEARAWAGKLTPTSFSVKADITQTMSAVRLVVSQSSDMTSPVYTSDYSAGSLYAGSLSYRTVQFDVGDLTANTTYYWQLEFRDAAEQKGTIRSLVTAPESGAFSFAFSSCSDLYPTGAQTGYIGAAPIFACIAADAPLFFFHQGDWVYTDCSSLSVGYQRDRCARAYLGHPDVQAMHNTLPIVMLASDHDMATNDPSLDTANAAAIFANSRQAFDEIVPHFPFELADTLVQVFDTCGARFLLLDAFSASSYTGNTCLGAAQLVWLQQQLDQAGTDGVKWLFISHGRTWTGSAFHGFSDSFPDERQAISDMIEECSVPVCLLIGDAHAAAADDGTNTAFATDGFGKFPQIFASGLQQQPSATSGPYSWNGTTNIFDTPTYGKWSTLYATVAMSEDNESWTAVIKGGPITGTTATELLTVSSTDVTPAVSFTDAAPSAGVGEALTVDLDKTWFGPCSVGWASSDGQSGTVTFKPNKTRASFDVTLASTATITLSNPAGCTISGTNPATVTVS